MESRHARRARAEQREADIAEVSDRLVVELQANIDKLSASLDKAVAKLSSAGAQMERKAQQTTSRIERLFGEMDVGKAIDTTFAKTRLAALEEGGARIPLFGSALEELGAAGLIAAAGVGAAALAMEGAKKAAEGVEKLENAAKELGIAGTTLQELQFAGQAHGVAPEQTIASLEALNQMLGAIQAGEPRAKLFKEELAGVGFTSEQIMGFKTVADFLPAFADKIRDAGSVAEQARITDRLGLKELQPMLKDGSKGLADMAAEFRKTGVEIDNGMLAKVADLDVEMNKASATMSGALTHALLSLAGPITATKTLMAGLIEMFAEANDYWFGMFAKRSNVSDAANDYSTAMSQVEQLKAQQASIRSQGSIRTGRGMTDSSAAIATLQREIDAAQARADAAYVAMQTANQAFNQKNAPETPPPPPKNLVTPKTKGAAGASPTEITDRVGEMLDEAQKTLAAAEAELTENVLAHAKLEKQAVDDEAKDKNDKLLAEKQAVDGDKKLSAAKKQTLDAEIATAIAANQGAAAAKKAKIDRDAENKIIEQRLAHEAEIAGYAVQILNDAESMADTSAQRRALQLASLAIEQQRQQAEQDNKNRLAIQAAGTDPAALAAAQAQAAQATAALNALQAAQTAKTLQDTASPGNAYAANLNKTYGGSLTDQFQTIDVSGINSLGEALDAVILKTKTAKQAFHEWAMGVVKDMLSLGTKDLIERPLANLMFPGNQANTGGAMAGSTASAATALSGLTSSATSAALALNGLAGANGASSLAGGAGANGQTGGLLGGLMAFLPHFAGGTDYAFGGPAVVGDGGEPEIVNLPRGATVTPMSALKAARGISAGGMRVSSSTYAPTFNLSGAVMTEDLMRQVNTQIALGDRVTLARSVQAARMVTRNDMATRSRQTLGR